MYETPQPKFIESVIKSVKENYCNFHGRARRAEYWWFQLGISLLIFAEYAVIIAIGLICFTASQSDPGSNPPFWLLTPSVILLIGTCLGLGLPSISVKVRRLHDVGKSGWCFLLPVGALAGTTVLQLIVQIGKEAMGFSSIIPSILVMVLSFIIRIGACIYMFVLYCTDSQRGPNKWGESPKYPAPAVPVKEIQQI